MDVISAPTKETPESSLAPFHNEDTARRQLLISSPRIDSLDSEFAGPLILGVLDSKTVRIE